MRSARRNREYDELYRDAEWTYVPIPKREHVPANLFWSGVLLLSISLVGFLFWLEASK